MNTTQPNTEDTQAAPVNFQTVLSKDQFKEFYTFIDIIKFNFTDFCMMDGTCRMRSDDNTCIVETEFEYFKGADLYISDAKMFVKMLSTLSKKIPITLTIEEDNIIFCDGYQSVQLQNCSFSSPENTFVPDDEMLKYFELNIGSIKPLLKETLAKPLVCNIKKVSKEFKTERVTDGHVEGDPTKGCLLVTNRSAYGGHSGDGTREYTIKLKNHFLCPMPINHFFIVSIKLFSFDKSDMVLDYYLDGNNERIIITIHHTRIDGLFINIYGRASVQSKD
jgi:hypothetical protein